jgi:hypothetical protein
MVLADELATYAGAAAALLVAGAGGLVKLGNVALKKQIDALKLELAERIGIETDGAVNKFGEAMSAVRQKISDMELWNRDNFVNQRTFEAIVSDLRRLEDKIDRRFDAVDRKLTKMDTGDDH